MPEEGLTVTGTGAGNTVTVSGDVRLILSDAVLETLENEQSLIDIQSGNVVLELKGTNKLTNGAGREKAALRVSSEASLTVEGEGSLEIYNGLEDGVHEANGAGIGGNFEESPGAITIQNGTISVLQYGTSAAIGGGARADSGKISITGGIVDVEVLPAGEGIESAGTGIGGGGENVKDNSLIGSAGNADVSITGGQVNASVKSSVFSFGTISSGAAIGSGENKGGNIYIGGSAVVTAKAENLACAIGSSNATWSQIGDSISPAPENPMNIVIEGNAQVFAETKSLDYYGQGAYAGAAIGMSVQNLQPCNITIGGTSKVEAQGSWYGAGIGGGYVQINDQAQPMTITIKDSADVTASGGVYGAGIGSGYGNSGAESPSILIEGNPTVHAYGGWGGAGIGGGKGTSGGNVTITGGNITAKGGVGGTKLFGMEIGGAGIGAGASDDSYGIGADFGAIKISGGTVAAYGSVGSAGIGGGNVKAVTASGNPSLGDSFSKNAGGTEEISITGNSRIFAVGGAGAAAVGTGASYEGAPEASVGSLTITDQAEIEAYADGAKFAIDLQAETINVSNVLLNGRFAEGELTPGKQNVVSLCKGEIVDYEMTIPADYRSFAVTASDGEGIVRVQNGEEGGESETAYYRENGKMTTTYPLYADDGSGYRMVTKDDLRWIEPLVLEPASMIIYMGGTDGYEGVVGENGEIQGNASKSLPEPGFYFTLPYDLNDELKKQEGVSEDTALDLSKYVTFKAENKTWSLELYGEMGASSSDGKNIYRIVSGPGQEPVRVQFTDEEGGIHINDSFDVSKEVYDTYVMEIYTGAVNQDGLVAVIKGQEYPVISKASELTVRGITPESTATEVQYDEIQSPVKDATAVAEKGTEFRINDSEVKVTDGTPALLSDEILTMEDSENLLEEKVNLLLDGDHSGRRYDFMYLDLVDAENGNVWIKADRPVAVYLPYPEGTDQNTEFDLLHFEGLDRDMEAEDIESQIASCDVKILETENTDHGIRFMTDSFSPFTLTWKNSYQAEYEFVSGTVGKELPQTVLELLPRDDERYPERAEVEPKVLSAESVKTEDGIWKFAGWNPEKAEASENLIFTGTWIFTEDSGASVPAEPSEPSGANPSEEPSPNPSEEENTEDSTESVHTGDSTPIFPFIAVMILAAGTAAATGTTLMRKKKHR